MKNNIKKIKWQFAKIYTALTSIITAALFGVLPAYAAGFDTTKLKDGIEKGLMAVLGITGAGLAVFGVIHLIEAQSSSDPNAKSQAIKQLAAGLGIIIVAAILVPVFMSAVTF